MGGRPMGSRVPPFNQMRNRMTSKPAAAAFIIAASLAVPATAHADDAVPTVDEVVAVLARLTDPNIPAIEKNDVVTPGFSPDDAATIDTHLQRLSQPELSRSISSSPISSLHPTTPPEPPRERWDHFARAASLGLSRCTGRTGAGCSSIKVPRA
jgi:hypothetical protein